MCDVWIITHDGGVYIVEMDKEIYLSGLYDYYGELLSDDNRKYFEDYYFDNLSLSEIAENNNPIAHISFRPNFLTSFPANTITTATGRY